MALTDEQKEEFFTAIEAFYFQKDDSKAEVLFRIVDKNGDGSISIQEFFDVLKKDRDT